MDNYFYIITEEDPIIEKIRSFQDLQIGWDFGQGVPPPEFIIRKSIKFYQEGLNQGFKCDANPAPNGGIIISLFIDDNFIFITLNPDNTYDFIYEKGIGEGYEILIDEENVTLHYINNTIKNLKQQWLLLEPLISSNTITIAKDSQAIVLRNLGTEYQYFRKIVPEMQVMDLSAYTYPSTTQEPLEFHLYSAK